MTKAAISTIRSDVYKLLIAQCLVVLLLTIGFKSYAKLIMAISCALGGLICIIPNFFFAKRLLTKTNARNPKDVVKTLFIGEIIKLLSIGTLFALILKYIPVTIFPLLVGFMGAQFAFWLAPILLSNPSKGMVLE